MTNILIDSRTWALIQIIPERVMPLILRHGPIRLTAPILSGAMTTPGYRLNAEAIPDDISRMISMGLR